MKLRIGSRGSALALWQAEHVRSRLSALDPALDISIEIIHTTGDKITDVALSKIGDKGLFTKELDRAIVDNQVDLAVHSLKDIPTAVAEGLELSAVLERIDPRDALVVAPGRPTTLAGLAPASRVGTSSLRRKAQLLALRPDLVIADLRGNLDTRLGKVADGQYDAVILALAGIERLGFTDRVAQRLDPPDWLPAVGQGALGITTRTDDTRTRTIGAAPRARSDARRSHGRARTAGELEGGCQIPIGALGTRRGAAYAACAGCFGGRHARRPRRAKRLGKSCSPDR